MTYPKTTDADLKQNVQAAVEDRSRARSSVDALLGREFSNGHLFTDVSDNTSVGVLLEVPADAECYAFVDSFFSVTGKSYVKKVDSVTRNSAGTVTGEQNRLISDGDACATVEYGADVSGGNEWTPKVIGSSSEQLFGTLALAPGSADGPAIILQPGENVYFEAENISGGTIDISIDTDWTEIPLEEVPEL